MTTQQAMLIDLPEQIETERLILRTPRAGDGAMMNAAIRESQAELAPWMPWARELPSLEDSEENVRRAAAKVISREDIRIHFHLKSDGLFVGGSGLHRINWAVPKFEIGYWVRTSLAGRGYVSEAVTAIKAFALTTLKANRVEIRADEKNVRSVRVAERCGFQLEGTLRNETVEDGKLRNTVIYSVVP